MVDSWQVLVFAQHMEHFEKNNAININRNKIQVQTKMSFQSVFKIIEK